MRRLFLAACAAVALYGAGLTAEQQAGTAQQQAGTAQQPAAPQPQIRTAKQVPFPQKPDWAKLEVETLHVQGKVHMIAGAGGNIAVQAVAQAPADGYTLVLAANYVAVNAAFKRNPYDWEKDLAPVALIASTPNLLVVPAASPLNNVNDLVNAAKRSAASRPLTFGSPGVGSSVHLAGELFKSMAGVDMTHVPYKGVSAAEVDLVGGTIDLMFDSISTAAPLAQAGKLKTIAVTGLQRVKALPQVPTMVELGMKNFEVEATYMVIAPARTPPEAIQRLSVAIAEVTAQPDVQRVVEGLYARPLSGGPAETKAFLAGEERKWQDLVKRSNLKID